MSAYHASSEPDAYLVFNPETDGYRVYESEAKAMIVSRQRPQYRLFPIWGQEVDEKLLSFVRWATAA